MGIITTFAMQPITYVSGKVVLRMDVVSLFKRPSKVTNYIHSQFGRPLKTLRVSANISWQQISENTHCCISHLINFRWLYLYIPYHTSGRSRISPIGYIVREASQAYRRIQTVRQ